MPLYEITYDKDYYGANLYAEDRITRTQIETKLRPGNLDIRAGVPLSVFCNMMNPYLEKRQIAVDEEFSPLTDADGEDILRFRVDIDGTDAWIELDR